MFFKNKHIITSMIVAPILALISYFAVDYYVSETPHKIKKGNIYTMLAKPNCRWESGKCELINNDLKITITTNSKQYGNNFLQLKSSIALTSVKFALVSSKDNNAVPKSMQVISNDNKQWQSISFVINKTNYLQFVINVSGSIFYAQVPAIFIYKEILI